MKRLLVTIESDCGLIPILQRLEQIRVMVEQGVTQAYFNHNHGEANFDLVERPDPEPEPVS